MQVWKHFKTITSHRILVMKYCFKVGLYWQGLTHDLSKYSFTEFWRGCKYYQGNRSPNNKEREETGISLSWLHHKGRNKHHFEYWIDYGYNSELLIEGLPMPKKYIAEMVMDRISASKTYLGDKYTDTCPYEYHAKSADKLWFIHKDTKRDLEYLLKLLYDQGEDAMISYIKNVYLKDA